MAAAAQTAARNWTGDRAAGSPAMVPFEPHTWPEPAPPDRARDRHKLLARAVELEVVPRLVLGSQWLPTRATVPAKASPPPRFAPEVVGEFAALLVGADGARARAFADQARSGQARASGLPALFLGLLAPAAAYLDEQLERDALDLASVTIGRARLHLMLRAFAPEFYGLAAAPRRDRQALLLAPPGEPHCFGLAMMRAFFNRASWGVWHGTPEQVGDPAAIVRDDWFAIVGFSLDRARQADRLRDTIGAVRSASRNRQIGIIVGGRACIDDPQRVAELGADAMAEDADQAVRLAEDLLAAVATPA